YRNTGADATFLAGWAVVFERADLSRRSIVERYEQLVAPLQQEVADKRRALLEAHRQQASGPASSMVDSDKEFLARHADLTARDHVIGLEASLSAAEAKLRDVRSRNRQLRDKLEAVEAHAQAGFARKVVRRLRRGLTR
ncbi:MAG TPA: hypothetical protein VLI04_13035, partial [Nocardioidaceae bacterium]|nr:hypothetical protein [Nocardioidaceae bacterium]